MFSPCTHDPDRYIVNNVGGTPDDVSIGKEEEEIGEICDEEEEKLETIDTDMIFTERILQILSSSKKGVKMETLLRLCEPYKDEEGPFLHLQIRHRVRACLIMFKLDKVISYDAVTERWRVSKENDL